MFTNKGGKKEIVLMKYKKFGRSTIIVFIFCIQRHFIAIFRPIYTPIIYFGNRQSNKRCLLCICACSTLIRKYQMTQDYHMYFTLKGYTYVYMLLSMIELAAVTYLL